MTERKSNPRVVSMNAAKPKRRALLKKASSIERRKVEWLWRKWIPRGKLTMLEGDPDVGKTTLMLDLISRVTTGLAMPDRAPGDDPADVIILTAEDDLGDTLCPRLEAAQADLDRVHFMTAVINADGKTFDVVLPHAIEDLEVAITETQAALMLIDPLFAFLGRATDSSKDDSIRRESLTPLRNVAEHTRAAIVGIRHHTKNRDRAAIHRGGGSVAVTAAARSVLMVAHHPEDENIRVLASAKNNLSLKPESLTYRIAPSIADPDVPRVEWTGTIDASADELLAAQASSAEDKSALDEAKDFLRDELASGPVQSKRLFAGARHQGIADRTLRRAKTSLGVTVERVETAWYWLLKGKP